MTWLFTEGSSENADARTFFGSFAWTYSWTAANDPTFRHNVEALTHGRCSLFSFRPSQPGKHMADYYLGCVGLAPGRKPLLSPPEDIRRHATSCLRNRGIEGRSLLLLHPGSGSPKKNWPLDLFYETVCHWTRMGGEAAFFLGPAESELPSRFERWPSFRHLPLSIVAGVLSQAAAFVGNDSGVTHLAAAIGVPTFALFRASDPDLWAPRGDRVLVLLKGKGKVTADVHQTGWGALWLEEFLQAKTSETQESFSSKAYWHAQPEKGPP
jgi:ADP-heptose:LPS heptosyltransferase